MRATTTRSRAGRRLAVAAAISVGAVLTAMVVPSGSLSLTAGESRGEADGYKKAYVAAAKNERSAAQGSGTIFNADGSHIHTGNLDGHAHDHSDPRTKNAVSRAAVTTNRETEDPTTPAQARLAVGAAEEQRSQTEPKLSNVPVERAARLLADQPLQHVQRLLRRPVGPDEPLARRRHDADLHRDLDRCRSPAVLQAHRARPLHALQPREDLPRRRPARRELRGQPGPEQQLGRDDAEERPVPVPDPRQGLPGRHRLQGHGHEHRDDVPAAPAQRLHGLPRDQHQRLRQPVLRSERHPGGPRLHRRAHPRHGLRVPGRPGALRPALVAVRRGAGAEGLPGPRDHRGQGRGDGGVPVRTSQPTTRSAGRPSRTGRRRSR